MIVCGVEKLERKRRDREAEREWEIEREGEGEIVKERENEGDIERQRVVWFHDQISYQLTSIIQFSQRIEIKIRLSNENKICRIVARAGLEKFKNQEESKWLKTVIWLIDKIFLFIYALTTKYKNCRRKTLKGRKRRGAIKTKLKGEW